MGRSAMGHRPARADDEPPGEAGAGVSKLMDLVHYAAWRAADADGCAAGKLFRILWSAEVNNYVRSGRLISDVRYVRTRHGLRPACWNEVCRRLEARQVLRVDEKVVPEPRGETFVVLRLPDDSSLTRQEQDLVDFWIARDGGVPAPAPSQ